MKKSLQTVLFVLLIALIIFFSFKLFLRDGDSVIGNTNIETNMNTNASTTASSTSSDTININKQENKNMEDNIKEYTTVTLDTNMGKITFELSKDKPLTTSNFIKLASSGFYDNVKFHRVINGFMIQTGDPLSKDESKKSYWGTGGPGYKFNDELTGAEKYMVGTVAMANSGPNTNGSQFFIMTSDTPLPPSYTVFGRVVAGQDVAQKIQNVATDASDKPLSPVVINKVELK